tara:strand:- start:2657 stop:3043 length:387 start_codon:yes stop_codon:yes gene_type:complete
MAKEIEFIKTIREIIGEVEDRYDIKTKKSIISQEEAVEFLKEKNVFCTIGPTSKNEGYRIYFTLDKTYVIEIWDKEMKEVKIFEEFKDVLSFLKESYPEKDKITIKLEIIPQGYGETARKYNYNLGDE